MDASSIKLLLIEDDEDDFITVRSYLSDVRTVNFEIEWAPTYTTALNALESGNHDACLLDYRLGERDGLDLLGQMTRNGLKAPVIFLTGYGDYRLDMEAMRAGACDYLAKDRIDSHSRAP